MLDLFCCAGGAARGYASAGWDLVGVDIAPQPRYPFRFIQADAVRLLRMAPGLIRANFDAIHASPPCQRFSQCTQVSGNADDWPDLVAPIRAGLKAIGLPYVIENVPGAPVRGDLILDGAAFGLGVRRRRLFELGGWFCMSPPPNVLGSMTTGHYVSVTTTATQQSDGKGWAVSRGKAVGLQAMGLAGAEMTHHELGEAIPPAYTNYIGERLRSRL